MTLLGLIVLVVLVCLAVYLIQSWAPPVPIRTVVYVILLVVVLALLLNAFGVFGSGLVLNRRL